MSENNDFFEETEQVDSDESFYERADEFIALANQFADADHQVWLGSTARSRKAARFSDETAVG